MKGFKNMKKIVAVLVLALVAMTAVFAIDATSTKSNDDLIIKLNVGGYTRFGFTEEDYTTEEKNSVYDVTLHGDIEDMNTHVGSQKAVTIYATVISTNKTGVNVEIELPKEMSNTDTKVTDTISITYEGDWSVENKNEYNLAATSGVLRDSRPITFYIEDPANKVAGSYQATLKMYVTAN